MLEIKKITKVYKDNGQTSKALKDISVNFRECEFASILGPSGSGKTTFLNIIGGLDHYTSGDLIINETSTKKYKDSDWDSYRNHRIGFIFQSYQLIPHQNILKNVSLALNLSGINKKEAERRAKKALEDVGLGAHIHKRPNQLSGGQMQRVAIARALVNNPEILLADEPTGALDSETSVQIMNLLKEISKKKLVIMVTHNPELAEEYSTRIITLKDGKITSDTDPYDGKKDTSETEEKSKIKHKKTKMSLLTSFRLSASNLLTKKARTLLVAIAGSIGIIGIALVLAISNGFQRYVDDIEESTLTSYPLTLMEETSDMTSLLLSVAASEDSEVADGVVKENQLITSTLSSLSINDLGSFKKHLEENNKEIEKDVERITYNYSIDPLIYTYDKTGKLSKLNPSNLFSSIMGSSSLLSSYSSYTSIFSKLPTTNKTDLEEKNELLAGRFPEKYDEIVISLKDKNSISELLVYSLGFRDMDELKNMITKIMAGESIEKKNEPLELSYEDLMNVELKLIQPADLYRYNSEYNIYEDMSENKDYMKNLYNNATTLKIVGVMTPKDDSGLLSGSSSGIFYSPELIDHIINYAKETDIVKKQLANDKIDVFSNKRFDEKSDSLGLNFTDFVAVDEAKLKGAFNINIDQNKIEKEVANKLAEISKEITTDITPAKNDFNSNLNSILEDFNNVLIERKSFKAEEINSIADSYFKTYAPQSFIKNLNEKYFIPSELFTETYSGLSKVYLVAYANAFGKFVEENPEYLGTHPEVIEGEIIVEESILMQVFESFKTSDTVNIISEKLAHGMAEAIMKKSVMTGVGEIVGNVTNSFASAFNIDPNAIASAFKLNVTEEEITRIITAMMSKTEATAKTNLISLGYQDKESPTSIYVYFSTFEGKENFLKFLDNYNNSVPEEQKIKYSDTTGILMSSVKTIVDAVTYVLIGFVSVSLIVSSIMIGVITYISVYERTKEIGILRAIGASKRNISNIFNAETFIIGLLSGLLAVGISYLLIIVINIIIYSLTSIENLQAYLTPENSTILVILSVVLTLIGGFIPAKSASKKDPVEALRSE